MKNRAKIESFLFSSVESFCPDKEYIAALKKTVGAMSNARFTEFIKNREFKIVTTPLKQKDKLSIKTTLDFLEANNRSPYKRVVIVDEVTGIKHSPDKKSLCLPLPCKRVVQTLFHKRSIPTSATNIDQRTDQVTGASKGSRISNVEALIISSQGDGYPNSLREFYKYRGGDNRALNAMNKLIITQGGVKHATLNSLGSRPKVVEVLSSFLTAQHLRNRL